jgi:hypothetical protein
MDRDSIHDFVRELAGPNVELVDHTKWVSFRCLLAPWTHAKGTDSTPSAGISINEDGASIYNCYSCTGTRKGPLTWLLKELEKYTGESYKDLRQEIDGNEFLGGSLPQWGLKKTQKNSKLKTLEESTYLDLFDKAEDHWYVQSRGVSPGTARYLGLLLDSDDGHGIERVVFPVYTPDRELVGFTGRAVVEGVNPRVRDYYGLSKEKVLLGSHLIAPQDPYVILVEGLFDYAVAAEYGYPAVAAMHAGLTDYQAKLLRNMGKPVVLMLDNDDAGREGQDIAISKLAPYLPLSYVKYPKERRGKKCLKDPASLSAAQMDGMLDKTYLV